MPIISTAPKGTGSGGVYVPCIDSDEVPLVELMYPVFTRMPGESYCRQLGSLLYLWNAFRVLINSLVGGHLRSIHTDIQFHPTIAINQTYEQALYINNTQLNCMINTHNRQQQFDITHTISLVSV